MTSRFALAAVLLAATVSMSAIAADAPHLCGATDKVVFSCPLAGGKKTVSLCAGTDGAIRYAFGQPGKIELTHPSEAQDAPLSRTHLSFGGASGGAAYAFDKGGYQYIVYSISGTGMDRGGVVVRRDGEVKAARDMQCQAGKITNTSDEQVIDQTLKLKSDPEIQSHGLPTTH
ncbi:MAG TPA: hypothetical protein VIM98_00185 [Dyella sp.]|uniref:hypothetical protein n=1 Tax=Dyella sp. TaxID=1869338 RepID=UPI002F93D644